MWNWTAASVLVSRFSGIQLDWKPPMTDKVWNVRNDVFYFDEQISLIIMWFLLSSIAFHIPITVKQFYLKIKVNKALKLQKCTQF